MIYVTGNPYDNIETFPFIRSFTRKHVWKIYNVDIRCNTILIRFHYLSILFLSVISSSSSILATCTNAFWIIWLKSFFCSYTLFHSSLQKKNSFVHNNFITQDHWTLNINLSNTLPTWTFRSCRSFDYEAVYGTYVEHVLLHFVCFQSTLIYCCFLSVI